MPTQSLRKCISVVLLLALTLTLTRASWTFQHQICSSDLLFTDPHSAGMQSLKGISQSTVTDRRVTCRDADYIQYVKQELPSSDGWKKKVLEAISSLYTDLEESKQPKTLKVNDKTIKVFPMTFSIPEEFVAKTIPAKEKPFSRVVPGDESTYFSIYEELQYRQDLSRSMYSITYKKGGWDCLRHYEILAAGAVPLFFDIDKCPNQTISLHPKRLYSVLLETPGLTYSASRVEKHLMKIENLKMDIHGLDKRLYMAVVASLLQYTRNIFSTKAMAAYVLTTIKKNQAALGSPAAATPGFPTNILYISHQDSDMDKGDYMTDFLLHGLLALLGSQAVTEFPVRSGLYKTDREFNESSEYIPRRKKLYGMGFSWGLSIDDWELKSIAQRRQHDDIVKNIKGKAYDLVILGSGHRDGWAARLYLWDQVCANYPPAQVAWVEGSDNHLFSRDHPAKMLQKYSPCAEHLFSREGHSPTFSP